MTHEEISNIPIKEFYEGFKKWANVLHAKGESVLKEAFNKGIPVGHITMLYGRQHSKSLFQSYYEHLLETPLKQ